jgi:hypothetical protein
VIYYTKRNYHGNYVKSLGGELIEVLNPQGTKRIHSGGSVKSLGKDLSLR